MYHYTPNKHILDNLKAIRKARYLPNKEWNFIHAMCKNCTYDMYIVLATYWEDTSFYSKQFLREVPCHGLLFPLYLFDVSSDNM